ncbi:MAG: hypothetical protein HYT76_09405 [Deltaproteobacteria bacterium]|nr:hypothetical protein [Deltaproteobacteria bacterium]
MALQASDEVKALFPGNHFIDAVELGPEDGVLLDLDGIQYDKAEGKGRPGLLYRGQFRQAIRDASQQRDRFVIVGFTRDRNIHPKGSVAWDFLKTLYGNEGAGGRVWHVPISEPGVLHTAHGPVQGVRWLICWRMTIAGFAFVATISSLR